MTDRALYVAMTGASANLQAQASVSNNLSNADTVGFQATLDGTIAAPVTGAGLASRVAVAHRTLGVSATPGALQNTGGELDIALHADRWLSVQAPDGSTAYTRAGNLQLTPNGLLTTASGLPVLGADGAPLAIPPYQSLHIGGDGTISIVPQGQPASTLTEGGRIGIVQAATRDLVRGDDGLMRAAPGTTPPAPATGASLTAGALEGSNVDATGMLVSMIQLARQFETQVRLLHTEDQNAQSANSLLSSR